MNSKINASTNDSYDYVRSLGIIMIVTSHFFLFGDQVHLRQVGFYLANTGNFLFISLSALLFGLKFIRDGKESFRFLPFAKKRLIRLLIPLWIFLMVYVICYVFIIGKISALSVFLNFIGLGWFSKLPMIGHLWFITMIIVCYIMYCVVARLDWANIMSLNGYEDPGKDRQMKVWGGVFLIISIIIESMLDRRGLPGYSVVLLYCCCYIFLNAGYFIKIVGNISGFVVVLIWIIINFLAFITCLHSEYFSVTLQRVLCFFSGFLWIVLILHSFGRLHSFRKSYIFFTRVILVPLSTISYELYIVHHIFCCGNLSVLHFTTMPVINYILLWVISLPLAWCINLIGSRIKQLIMK